MKAYLLRVAIAVDCFVQALCNRGTLGITISARADTARFHGHRWGCLLCRLLDWLQEGHCAGARLGDMRRAQDVIDTLREYR